MPGLQCGPQVSEATALPAEPKTIEPKLNYNFVDVQTKALLKQILKENNFKVLLPV